MQLRKGGVKLRWDLRSIEENDGQPVDKLAEVKKTSYWWKGSFNVDFSKIRVTSMKGNRRYIMPYPINKRDFEVIWEAARLECTDVARNVRRSLASKFCGKKFFNVSVAQQRGIQSLEQRRVSEGLVFFETDK